VAATAALPLNRFRRAAGWHVVIDAYIPYPRADQEAGLEKSYWH
jgi:hypothetical protein